MADSEVVKDWLRKADEDFGFAGANLREDGAYYSQVCFHFHQAAEKYLKAYIVAHALEFEKTHDLVYLLKVAAKKEPVFTPLLGYCELLNPAYIDTRYPVHWPTNYTYEKAVKAKEAAAKIATAVKKLLNV